MRRLLNFAYFYFYNNFRPCFHYILVLLHVFSAFVVFYNIFSSYVYFVSVFLTYFSEQVINAFYCIAYHIIHIVLRCIIIFATFLLVFYLLLIFTYNLLQPTTRFVKQLSLKCVFRIMCHDFCYKCTYFICRSELQYHPKTKK